MRYKVKELLSLSKYFKKHKLVLTGSVLYILFTNLIGLLIPWILKLAIDSIGKLPHSQVQLIKYGLMLLAVSAVEGVLRFYMRKLLIGVSRKIEYSIRADFFSHFQKLDSSFFENNRTGSIMALITNDLDAVRNFLGPGLLNLFNTIFIFISTLIVMFLINVKLSFYSMIAFPILPLLVWWLSSKLYERFKISQEQYASLSARTQESLAGIKVVKSFTQEKNEKDTFSDLNREYIKKNMAFAKIRSIFWPAMIFIGGIGIMVVLLVGGKQVIAKVLTLGQFVQFSAYIGSITWPLISLGWVINLIQRGSVSMGRLNNVFKIKPSITDPPKPSGVRHLNGNIIFKNVFFKYPQYQSYEAANEDNKKNDSISNDWILRNINFEIKGGTQVGIVGFTGSGKSTIVNLIPRLYDPQEGYLTINGHNLKDLNLAMLRSNIGYVTQEPFIFSKTIKENIQFGREELFASLSPDEIEHKVLQASKVSHLHEDVLSFPDGYATIIGERGVTLSGGQKQRLAIARAIIIEPRILILDDSFSSVDTNTEELILNDLKEKTGNLTRIIISHRISTIKDSDLILVLDEGQITETGTHSQLLKSCGIYQKLYQRQQLSEKLDEEI
ncbi:MAG: ABC transporter ATP-binding protein/permease [Actinobacteria bacterium]|nr:ABC transporter ATP-binding protein/permease [Actinomycetota bacterium]